jgi:hypothetical protein
MVLSIIIFSIVSCNSSKLQEKNAFLQAESAYGNKEYEKSVQLLNTYLANFSTGTTDHTDKVKSMLKNATIAIEEKERQDKLEKMINPCLAKLGINSYSEFPINQVDSNTIKIRSQIFYETAVYIEKPSREKLIVAAYKLIIDNNPTGTYIFVNKQDFKLSELVDKKLLPLNHYDFDSPSWKHVIGIFQNSTLEIREGTKIIEAISYK